MGKWRKLWSSERDRVPLLAVVVVAAIVVLVSVIVII